MFYSLILVIKLLTLTIYLSLLACFLVYLVFNLPVLELPDNLPKRVLLIAFVWSCLLVIHESAHVVGIIMTGNEVTGIEIGRLIIVKSTGNNENEIMGGLIEIIEIIWLPFMAELVFITIIRPQEELPYWLIAIMFGMRYDILTVYGG